MFQLLAVCRILRRRLYSWPAFLSSRPVCPPAYWTTLDVSWMPRIQHVEKTHSAFAIFFFSANVHHLHSCKLETWVHSNLVKSTLLALGSFYFHQYFHRSGTFDLWVPTEPFKWSFLSLASHSPNTSFSRCMGGRIYCHSADID